MLAAYQRARELHRLHGGNPDSLHAHMMAIPFTILVIALGLNLAAGLRRLGWVWDAAALLAVAAPT